jgi:RNA polymerase sigma factor (TIGR02999 family)
MGEGSSTVTLLLRGWQRGDKAAFDELMPIVFAELHRIAARYLRNERAGHTFRPTDLVSEAYLRLVGSEHPEWNDRVHFFAIAARTMRQILVDHARTRNADKRGQGERPATFDELVVAGQQRPEVLIALDAALAELAVSDERKARTVELHYFAGLTQAEIASVLEVHVNTVARDLKFAEAWIHRHMTGGT